MEIDIHAMARLTEEMVESFKAVKIFPLATASAAGVPNVAPMGMVFLRDPETIWIVDSFMKKTLKNATENPKAALYVYGAGAKGCLQIKADVTIATAGDEFDAGKALALERKPDLKPKSLLILKVSEVYSCAPGPNAGEKVI